MKTSPLAPSLGTLVAISLAGCASAPTTYLDRPCVNDLERAFVKANGGVPDATNQGLQRKEVSDPIEAKRDAFRDCYAKAVARDVGTGTVTTRFLIGPDGKIAKACAATSEFTDVEFHACVLGVLRGIPFPAPKAGKTVMVTYPLKFDRE